MKVRLTRPALDDLERIHAYISKDNPVAASRVVTRLIDRAIALADAPHQGRKVDERNARVIVVPRFRYFIFYTIENDEVQGHAFPPYVAPAAMGRGIDRDTEADRT